MGFLGYGLRPLRALLSRDQGALGVVEEIPSSLDCLLWWVLRSKDGMRKKNLDWIQMFFIANPIHGTAAWILEPAFSLYLHAGGIGKMVSLLEYKQQDLGNQWGLV